DFDVTPNPRYYGSFTSSTPIYDGSTAYGRTHHTTFEFSEGRASSPTYPRNRDLSYRHDKRMNVIYFDGHVDQLKEHESKRDASRWYPGGSVFTGVRATAESLEKHQEGEILR
ncbi:MAG: hypothetical protein VYC34_02130, partial [Planctomycetota bacterium]|nr:hypothetical protein [Planctomycetota bacterium]